MARGRGRGRRRVATLAAMSKSPRRELGVHTSTVQGGDHHGQVARETTHNAVSQATRAELPACGVAVPNGMASPTAVGLHT